MGIAFPYRINSRGRTSEPKNNDEYIRQAIEQTLFTMPGERVNRPEFGTGIMNYLFAPGGDEIMAAVQHMVQGALQQHLLDLAQIVDVEVKSEDAALWVTVQYMAVKSGQKSSVSFEYNMADPTAAAFNN